MFCGASSIMPPGLVALEDMRARMAQDETGSAILLDRPQVNEQTVDLEALRQLGGHTFGGRYVAFMDEHGYVG